MVSCEHYHLSSPIAVDDGGVKSGPSGGGSRSDGNGRGPVKFRTIFQKVHGTALTAEVGSAAERMWAHIAGSPQNPGRHDRGEFWTPWKEHVQPDFVPAMRAEGEQVVWRSRQYAQQHGVPSIDDALLVADSKYLGVLGDDVQEIDVHTCEDTQAQIRGMSWLARFTKGKAFMCLGREGQRLSPTIQQRLTKTSKRIGTV